MSSAARPPAPAATTVGEAVQRAAAVLRSTSATPRLDAEVLLGEVLGASRAQLVVAARDPLDADAAARFGALVGRRAAGEPVAHLLGRAWFRRLELAVDARVLVPRPETELLVEAAVAALPRGAWVVDAGTGSGAVALALADERPDLRLTGVDVSADALAVARANDARGAVDWVWGDLLAGLAPDAVVSNPPYVEAAADLPVDVRDFEPALALFAGEDGLDVHRRLWPACAAAGVAWVAAEHGASQGRAVQSLARAAGFAAVQQRQDLAGLDRVVVGSRT